MKVQILTAILVFIILTSIAPAEATQFSDVEALYKTIQFEWMSIKTGRKYLEGDELGEREKIHLMHIILEKEAVLRELIIKYDVKVMDIEDMPEHLPKFIDPIEFMKD